MDDAKLEINMKCLRDSIIFGKYEEMTRILTREYIEKEGTGWVHWAVRFEQKRALEYLLDVVKLDVNLQDGWTALHVASALGNREFIDILVKAGANKGIQNNDGLYPGSLAVNKKIEKYVGYHSGSSDPSKSWLCGTFDKDKRRAERAAETKKDKLMEARKKRIEEKKSKKMKAKKAKKAEEPVVQDQPDFDDDGFMTL